MSSQLFTRQQLYALAVAAVVITVYVVLFTSIRRARKDSDTDAIDGVRNNLVQSGQVWVPPVPLLRLPPLVVKEAEMAVIVAVRAAPVPTALLRQLEEGTQAMLVVVVSPPLLDSPPITKLTLKRSHRLNVISCDPGAGRIFCNYVSMCAIGAQAAENRRAKLLLFLSPWYSVSGPLKLFLRSIRDAFSTNRSAVVVGCTMLYEATDEQSGSRGKNSGGRAVMPNPTNGEIIDPARLQPHLAVLERGEEVAFATRKDTTQVLVSRTLSGFDARDGRLRRPLESTTFVSLHCMAVAGDAYASAGGLPLTQFSTVDEILERAAKGEEGDVEKLAALLKARTHLAEEIMVRISIADVRDGSANLRSSVRKAYSAVVAATQLWEEVTATKWVSNSGGALAEKEFREINEYAQKPLEERLAVLSQILADTGSKFREAWEYAKASENAPREEEGGWDLSLRMLEHGGATFVSNATVVFAPDLVPPAVKAFEATAHTSLFHAPTVAVSTTFRKRWGDALQRQHPGRCTTPPIRIVWHAYCCKCCGFANEIVHFVVPLQRKFRVEITPGPECFCPGYPRGVADTIERMHTSAESFATMQGPDDEIVVWISHNDPLSFRQPVFEVRKPDYVVGRSMYEFSRIEDRWAKAANRDADEVWVPAHFVKKVYSASGVDERHLHVVPEAVDTYFYDPAAHGKIELPSPYIKHWCNKPAPAAPFRFFTDFKWEPRKGWDTLFAAYYEAFRDSAEPVSLYILTHIWFPGGPETYGDKHNATYLQQEVLQFARKSLGLSTLAQFPHFCFLLDDLSETRVAELYNSVDAFVLPTRGEGWGLPAIQAMSMSLPTITTAWGGQLEFLRGDNSFPIAVDGVEELSADSVYVYQLGKKWAIPSLPSTIRHMQTVVSNRSLARHVGEVARRFIVRHFSEEAIVETVSKRIMAIRDLVMSRRANPGKL